MSRRALCVVAAVSLAAAALLSACTNPTAPSPRANAGVVAGSST